MYDNTTNIFLKPSSKPYILLVQGRDKIELQRLIETYDMRYFPQHVLLCTSTVHNQTANIYIQGYLRILWIRNTISSKI